MKTSESFIPIYFRLAEDIKQQVLSGKLKPGDMLPTEAQLCNQYGISRMTVRQGLKLLTDEGLIESYRGKGSFVAYPQFNELILELPGSQFKSLDDSNSRLLGVNVVSPDSTVASVLQLRPGSKVIHFRKLYLVNSEPVAIDTRYIVYRKGQPTVEQEIKYSAFPNEVARHTGLVSIRNKVTFSAVLLSEETAKILGTTAGKPALQIEQLVFGTNDRPLGWSMITCNSEKYSLSAYTKTFL